MNFNSQYVFLLFQLFQEKILQYNKVTKARMRDCSIATIVLFIHKYIFSFMQHIYTHINLNIHTKYIKHLQHPKRMNLYELKEQEAEENSEVDKKKQQQKQIVLHKVRINYVLQQYIQT